jgi:hypothetical protein
VIVHLVFSELRVGETIAHLVFSELRRGELIVYLVFSELPLSTKYTIPSPPLNSLNTK